MTSKLPSSTHSTTPSTTVTSPPIVISLFSTFSVHINGKPIDTFRSNKVRGLLAYLLLTHPQPLLRTTLVDLLWSGYDASSGRVNLRQVLSNIRDSLAPFNLLNANRHHVQLTVDPTLVWCDALHFTALLAACQQHEHRSVTSCLACQERLHQALALYKSPFLDNLPTVESAPFTNWLQSKRAYFAEQVAVAQTMLTAPTIPPSNLPRPLTSLIGRTAALRELAEKGMHPIYRCLTLIGPGGIGKTRLALALGEQLRAHFAHGVWFVALAALPAENPRSSEQTELNDRIATAISTALGLRLQGNVHPAQRVTEHLREQTLLLILDNFEHLSTGVDWLVTLLQEAPNVRLLVTSRHRLPLQAQLVYQVAGLALPPEKAEESLPPDQLIAHYASLQLFVERADNASFAFQRNPPNLAAISALCRLLEGAPLGIELAVALLERQTPGEILHHVRAHYAVLQANLGDLPQRQRSAYAVLHTAWGLLHEQEAQILARCSVFRGGFTATAARQIIDATPATLQALVNKSLIHFTADEHDSDSESDSNSDSAGGRYTVHELVRQFAAEQLTPQAAQPVHNRHAAYYLTLLEVWQPGAEAERAFRQAVRVDLANVESAWDWALSSTLVTRLPAAVNGLAEFYELINAHHAAEAILQRSVAQVRSRLAATPTTAEQYSSLQQLLAALLARLAYLYAQSLGQPQQALPIGEEALALAERLGNAELTTFTYFVLQLAAFGGHGFAQGRALADKGLALAQTHGLVREQALLLVGIGLHAPPLGDYTTGLNALTQAIKLAQQINDPRLEQMVRTTLGVTYRMGGDFAQAAHCFAENLPLLRQSDNQYQIAGVMLNLGILHLLLGDYTVAAEHLDQAYQMLTALGERRLAAECLFALGWNCVQSGDNRRAISYCRQSLAQVVSDDAQQMAWLTLGDAQLNAGDLEAAKAAFLQVVAISQRGKGGPAERWQAQAGLAAILLAQNDKVAALAAVNELLADFDPTQPDGWQCPQRLLLTCYRVLAANHDPRATVVLHQAWELVQSQAEMISDPALRSSFFTNVPVNRALATLIAA
ncbi:MAG: hypothetical protein DYG89_16005 [Caldilinea sp. CFX5]|nr:hypothetical protein [Caldilinea sp. CFX5]